MIRCNCKKKKMTVAAFDKIQMTTADIHGNKNNQLFISQHFINCLIYTGLNGRKICEYCIVNNVEGSGCHLF